MTNFKHGETTRMLLRGRSKALLIETCGSACGMLEGHLCEDCYDKGQIEPEKDAHETPSSLGPSREPLV